MFPNSSKWLRRAVMTSGWKKGGGSDVMTSVFVRCGESPGDDSDGGEDDDATVVSIAGILCVLPSVLDVLWMLGLRTVRGW